MTILTAESLSEMLGRCYKYSKYRGAILFNANAAKTEFIRSFARQMGDGSVYGIERITRFGTIKFDNGSEVKTLIAHEERLRGIRVNEVICDTQYSEDAVQFLRSEFYHCENDEDALQEDEKVCSLDDFLSQFKIL